MHKKTTLDNGLRIVTSSMPHTMSVSVCVFLGTGSRYETMENAGISHFSEHMLFKGTERRPSSKAISEAIDGIGGILNGGTDKELTLYWAKVARPHFNIALDLLVDMLHNSRFDPHEIENERAVIIEELNMCTDSPQSRADTLIDEVLWPDQALGRDILGKKETVNATDRQMIIDYIDKHYLARNTVVSVAGNIEHDEVVDSVAGCMIDWRANSPNSWFPADNTQHAPRVGIEKRKTEQNNFCLAVRGLSHLHRDRFILELLNIILGEGMSSRLFLELREHKGLTYDIHSHLSYFHDAGAVSIFAGVDPNKLESAITCILGEMVKLKDDIIAEEEIKKAKEFGKGRLMLRMEDTRNVSSWIGGQELLTENIRTIEDVVQTIDGITAKDIQRVARDLFVTNNLNLALVGPLKKGERIDKLLKL